MEESDLTYYTGAAPESLATVDIVIASGDIVSIDELPEDPAEILALLEAEHCAAKYWIQVSQAYVHAGKPNDALVIGERGLVAESLAAADRAALHGLLGWTHLHLVSRGVDEAANLDKATAHFGQLPDQDGASAGLARAQTALYRDQADVALQQFDRLLKADAANCYALLGKAHVTLAKTGNYALALKLYQQVLVLNPALTPDPRIGIGICFWFLKDRAMALSAWHRAVELNPRSSRAKLLLALASFDDVFTNSLSDDLFVSNYKAALVQLTTLQHACPDDHVVLLTLCSYYFSKGDHPLVEKIVGKVVAALGESISSGAKLSAATSALLSTCSFWLGRVAFAAGDFTQSQKNFHEAIRLNENNLLAKLGLGQSQLSRNATEEAIITFESILKTNPKCLEVNYSLGMLYAESDSRTKQEQAVHMLERYIRLSNNRGSAIADKMESDAYLNKEPVALNAYLTLSKLYEQKDVSQSLAYLEKAVACRQQIGQQAPLEVYNNIAVFNFLKNNVAKASESLDLAFETLEGSDLAPELKDDLKVSLDFNMARTCEASDLEKAVAVYTQVLEACPGYFSARLRLFFLDAVSNKSDKKDLEAEIRALLEDHASNLEIRSFYGWFIKNFGKKCGLKPDADTVHQKATLVDHDSHDSYALISLANIYCAMARELKGGKDEEKKKKYFLRAIELYTKVLSLDSKNVFAAQGLAIVHIENKDPTRGLDILRKIRDSLNDISVYLNLGHVLTDLKQYSKAVESYEIASVRFANGQDPKILGFLGRSLYLRGLHEKNLAFLKKSLEYSEEALSKATGNTNPYIFNVAFIQFQIAEFVSKQSVEHRVVEEINDAIVNLNKAISDLHTLASDDQEHPPYPKPDLKARANLGTTLLNRLNTCLDETKERIAEINSRLENAKKYREEEASKKAAEQEAVVAAQKAKAEELALERAKLQEQAQQWAEEARANLVAPDSDDDKAFDEEKGKKGKKKAKGKKKDFINDSDDDHVTPEKSDDEAGADEAADEEAKTKPAPKKKAAKRKRRAIEDDDEEPAEAEESKSKKYKSKEMVEDSSDDDLF